MVRRGARAGRVRAPAGRLRVLRQIGDQLVPGLEQFLFVDDVVPVEDGAALVAEALARRRARRDPTSPLVFHRDGIPIRRWRTAWRTACQAAGVPTRFLHDCRRTAARNLIRASVPERVAMFLTGRITLQNGPDWAFIPDPLPRFMQQRRDQPLSGC